MTTDNIILNKTGKYILDFAENLFFIESNIFIFTNHKNIKMIVFSTADKVIPFYLHLVIRNIDIISKAWLIHLKFKFQKGLINNLTTLIK